MKERIVIDEDFYVKHFQEREIEFQEEDMCSGGNPEEWWHYKKEQVPETFEDLKELCRELKNKDITIYDDAITIDFPSINGGFNFYIYITKNEIDINTSIFAQNRTIPQLWAFIKSLIGEEE